MYKVKANVVFPIICKFILSDMSQYLHDYCLVENFGRKIFWRVAKIMTFGGIYFGKSQPL